MKRVIFRIERLARYNNYFDKYNDVFFKKQMIKEVCKLGSLGVLNLLVKDPFIRDASAVYLSYKTLNLLSLVYTEHTLSKKDQKHV